MFSIVFILLFCFRDPSALQLLFKLFIERSHSLWKIPEVCVCMCVCVCVVLWSLYSSCLSTADLARYVLVSNCCTHDNLCTLSTPNFQKPPAMQLQYTCQLMCWSCDQNSYHQNQVYLWLLGYYYGLILLRLVPLCRIRNVQPIRGWACKW